MEKFGLLLRAEKRSGPMGVKSQNFRGCLVEGSTDRTERQQTNSSRDSRDGVGWGRKCKLREIGVVVPLTSINTLP